MYLLTHENNILDFGNKITKGDEKNLFTKGVIYFENGGAYGIVGQELFENIEIPQYILDDEYAKQGKYLFDGKEFTLNPNWQEPNKYNIPDETLNEILDDHNAMLIEGGIL